MSVKHQFLPPVQSLRQSRRVWLLALGLAMAPCLAAPVWAENFSLESVDFSNNDAGMRIILHTGSIVPVQKVLISDSKLVLDIDQVNTNDTVRTNFSQAGNVSHVIMQPLNEHKIRMIIRGEGLSAPTIAFFGAGSTESGGLSAEEAARLSAETSAALHRQQEAGLQSAVNNQTLAKASETAVDRSPLKDDEPIAFGGFVEDRHVQQTEQRHGKLETRPSETGPMALHSQVPAASTGNELLGQFIDGKWDKYIPFGLMALVMLGAGIFVRHKLAQLNGDATEYEDSIEAPGSGKRASFREMADAYRNKHEDKRAENAARKPNADSMIGLRGLHQQPAEELRSDMPQPVYDGDEPLTPNTLEQILSAMQSANKPKKPMGVPAPKKQAVNQYMQAQAPKASKTKTRPGADEAMLHEMKRAQAAQQELQQQARQAAAQAQVNKPGYTPVNRAAAAKKAVKAPNFQTIPSGNAVNAKNPARPGQSPIQTANAAPGSASKSGYSPVPPKPATAAKPQAPLPGNPEVLNFLRNVADLMEKDGKGEIAKSIHKNLSSKNIGGLK